MPGKAWNLERLRSESSYWRSCILHHRSPSRSFRLDGQARENSQGAAAHFGGSATGWEIFLDALCGMGLMQQTAANMPIAFSPPVI